MSSRVAVNENQDKIVTKTSQAPTVALVGPGAIGTTVAAALHQVGRTPTICGSSAKNHHSDGGRIALPGPVLIDPAQITETFDLVLVEVKSTQVVAMSPWRKLLVAGLMALTIRRAGMFRRENIGVLALAYLQECLDVARAEGATLGNKVPQEILDGFRQLPTNLGTSILADRQPPTPSNGIAGMQL